MLGPQTSKGRPNLKNPPEDPLADFFKQPFIWFYLALQDYFVVALVGVAGLAAGVTSDDEDEAVFASSLVLSN